MLANDPAPSSSQLLTWIIQPQVGRSSASRQLNIRHCLFSRLGPFSSHQLNSRQYRRTNQFLEGSRTMASNMYLAPPTTPPIHFDRPLHHRTSYLASGFAVDAQPHSIIPRESAIRS
ncbi:hypothetical protein PG999_000491 [Apiospora kogelbergensis]|uniref:Uncharacterized protein n=1 Tax=Apiospora kogelbergensis TaxID=1337665 RepID=A0AAW0RBV9_9PEZI